MKVYDPPLIKRQVLLTNSLQNLACAIIHVNLSYNVHENIFWRLNASLKLT